MRECWSLGFYWLRAVLPSFLLGLCHILGWCQTPLGGSEGRWAQMPLLCLSHLDWWTTDCLIQQKSEGFLLCWDTEVALSSHQSPLCADSPVLLISLLCFQNFTEALGEPERNLKQRAKAWLLDQFSHFLAGHSHLISPAASFVQQG